MSLYVYTNILRDASSWLISFCWLLQGMFICEYDCKKTCEHSNHVILRHNCGLSITVLVF